MTVSSGWNGGRRWHRWCGRLLSRTLLVEGRLHIDPVRNTGAGRKRRMGMIYLYILPFVEHTPAGNTPRLAPDT